MADSTFQDRYRDLLKQYILDSNEELLEKALVLGTEMLDGHTDPETIIEIHQEALKQLEPRIPSELFPPSPEASCAPLKAMFSAFGVLYRNQLDAFTAAAERFGRIKTVLGTVRDGIRLSTKEKDRDRLLQDTCDRFVQSKQYRNTWIALLDRDGRIFRIFQCGLTENQSNRLDQMLDGFTCHCVNRAIVETRTIPIEKPGSDCSDCPLSDTADGVSCLAAPITTGEKTYGVVVVALPTRFLNDAEEQELFSELTIDLALALHSMEMNEIRQQTEETNWRIMEELARSNTELEQFASIISHDLREPVRMVGSFVELLSRNYSGKLDEKADQYIYYAADGARRMQAMINNILDYSRVTTRGKMFEEVNLSTIIEEVLRDLSVKIEESGAEIITGDMPTVMGDRTQLTRVFYNLIANALKFQGEDPPRVEISARLDGGEWIISVRDNGIGIEPKFFKKIFYIFQRLHMQDEYPGTGIGLAITRKILQRHKGHIDVESKPGEGSTFFFTLPVMVKDERADGGTD